MKKWIIAVCDSASDLIPNAEHIERNDELIKILPNDYDDFKAAQEAKKRGVKLIDDIDGIYKDLYIDTPENRQIIQDYIKLHPEEVNGILIGKF